MSKSNLYILVFLLLLSIIGLWWYGPIPQDQAYHSFADQRTLLGIPNFWNVISNVPYFFLGIWGLKVSLKNWALRPDLVTKWLPIALCAGIFLAFFGSAYYHWAPDNFTLAWDRLPMTFMFMPIFALIIYDFIGEKWGKIAFYIFMPLGIFSILYWQYTESIEQGDLRVYAFVQFAPLIIGPIILWLSEKKRSYLKYILYMIGWYVLTKLSEHFDFEIYNAIGFWSGHTIKHLLGAVTLFYSVKLIAAWELEGLEIAGNK